MIRKSALLFALAVVASATCARAQFAVYGNVTVASLSGMQSSPQAIPGITYRNSVSPIGFTVGGYYDWRTFGPVTLGADVRFTHMTAHRGAEANAEVGGARVYSTLGGLRGTFHTPIKMLKPYVQASAGLGRSDYGFLLAPQVQIAVPGGYIDAPAGTPGPANNFQYNVFAGLDVKVLPIVDFRPIELGYGGLDPFGTYSHNYPLRSLSVGFVFHLPSGN